LIEGTGFPTDTPPMCKFGFPGKSTVTYGKIVNENLIACDTPAAQLSPRALGVSTVPFKLSFNNIDHGKLYL